MSDLSPESPIESLDIVARTYHAIKRQGINTIGELMALLHQGEAAVLKLRYFPEYHIIYTLHCLRANGYPLDDLPEDILKYLDDEPPAPPR
jgi:hypothetical protein